MDTKHPADAGMAAVCHFQALFHEIPKARRVTMKEERLRTLLIEALAGDARRYRQFLQELAPHLRGYLKRRLARMPDEVEDLVQEALLAIHNQRHTYDPAQPLTAWIYAIARYKLVDYSRRRNTREAVSDAFDDEAEVLAHSESEALDARRDIAVLLARLPDRQRLPIEHMKLHGLSVAEAARATGMSPSAVKVGVHRGLIALAAIIKGES